MNEILEKYIGLVFVLAGIHRVLLKSRREYEAYVLLKMPNGTDYLIIMIEIICGIIILFNLPKKREALIVVTLLASIGIIILLINNFDDILKTYDDLFTLHKNSLSVCLHLTYIIILIYLIYKK